MVKFSKQFEGQLVPEWKHAFLDYCLLKKDLKRMQHARHHAAADRRQAAGLTDTQETAAGHHAERASLSLSQWLLDRLPAGLFGSNAPNRDRHGVIHVHRRKLAGSASRGGGGDVYETELLEPLADDDGDAAAAREFFARLDAQLNKVNQFYRGKEQEFLERGRSLRRQMDILADLRAARAREDPSVASASAASEDEYTRYAMTSASDTDALQLSEQEEQATPLPTDGPGVTAQEDHQQQQDLEGSGTFAVRPPLSGCGRKSLKITIPLTTPSRTISALTDILWDELAISHFSSSSKKCIPDGKQSVSKTKLRHAEKMIKRAFVELYKGLGYLATYRSLNMMAFVKILKKFEKITGKEVLSIYLKALKLMDEVEDIFVRHFAGDNRRKAMKYLRPAQRRDSHAATFFTGLMAGCFAALFVGYCVMAHMAGMYYYYSTPAPPSRARGTGGGSVSVSVSVSVYMETAYPVLSMFALLFLHLLLYGCNMVAWRRCRVNYGFIFESSPSPAGGELGPRDVFLVCAASMAAVAGVMFAHLALVLRWGYHASPHVEAIPAFLLLVFLLLLFCPINVVYRSSRFQFLRILRNIVLSPLYKCARRWFDEGDTSHLVNLGKYVSAMLAAGAKVAYEKDRSLASLSLLVAVSSGATVYQLYWDFVKDWGLLQPNSKNPWLRNDLILRRKSIYYLSMGLNLVLRLAWLQTIIHPNFGSLDSRVTSFFLAALEVIRRGHWNFYRLENEHLNNAGKFRAVKTVPLPFHEVDDD
ncbi:phosphate transporter1 [Zea mays]|uniref:Phosphate transporter1 n=1 Tax=Zea mays TaxID=4577 RepID=A0A1D6MNB3_MAIZE|nr:phosphate transporter1 [Zea mays]